MTYNEQVRDIRKSFWTALKKSGIKDFRFHDLRHLIFPRKSGHKEEMVLV